MGKLYSSTIGVDAAGVVPVCGQTDRAKDQADFLSAAALRYIAGGKASVDDFTTHALTCTRGTVYGSRIPVPVGEELTKFGYLLQAEIEDVAVADQNFVGLYSAAGNLLWRSGDLSADANWVGPIPAALAILDMTTKTTDGTGNGSPIIVPGNPGGASTFVDAVFLGNADTSGIVPWVQLLTASSPGTAGNTGTQTDGSARGWTGRTGATTLAATTGTQTGILSQIFAAVG